MIEEYLKDNPNLNSNYRKEIGVVRRYEELTGKQLWEMNRDELASMLAYESGSFDMVSKKKASAKVYLAYLKTARPEITRVDEVVSLLDNIDILEVDISEGVKKKYVRNLSDALNRCVSAPDGSWIRLVVCLYWSGFTRQQIVDMMESDISIKPDKMVVNTDKGQVTITDPLIINIVKKYIATDEGVLFCRDGTYTIIPLVTDGHLLKKYESYSKRAKEYVPFKAITLSQKMNEYDIVWEDMIIARRFYDVYSDMRAKRKEINRQNVKSNMFNNYYQRMTFFKWYEIYYGNKE